MAELSAPASVLVVAGLVVWTAVVLLATERAGRRAARSATSGSDGGLQRIVRNAAVPIASQVLIRGIDLVVAIALLRVLGPEGNGRYAVAVVAWLYVKTISDFGLSVLAAREVARAPSMAGEVVGETTLVRWLVLAVTLAPLGALVGTGLAHGSLTGESTAAIAVLCLSIVPSSYSEAVSSALTGLERMALAAWLNIGVNVMRAPLAIALAATSLGAVGVALAALVAALGSAMVFRSIGAEVAGPAVRWQLRGPRLRWYLSESWPLLLNALLVSLFFRADVFIVQAAKGDTALGVYDASYKLINLLTIVPAYAVLAVFPLLVRRADDVASLRSAQRRTTYVLVTLAWVAIVGTTALARPLIQLLAGADYLPEAATLLRILIWFAPLSFLNGVTQYVLIARGSQRRLLPAFLGAVVFNLAANLASVPTYGARAAAATTVATEVVILAAFWLATRSTDYPALTRDVLVPLWRPSLAGLAAAAAALALADRALLSSLAAGGCLALLGLILRVVGPEERALLRSLVARRHRATTGAIPTPGDS